MVRDKFELVYTHSEIKEVVKSLASEIDGYYKGGYITLIPILNGAIYFATELSHKLKIPHNIYSVIAESYGGHNVIKHKPKVTLPKQIPSYMQFVVVEDIVNTGATITAVTEKLKLLNPVSINVVSLFCNDSACVRFKGFPTDNTHLVGYGMDYKHAYRHLKDIYKIKNHNHK